MRTLKIGLMVLGLMGIALVGVTSPASPVNKVVIGVLDFEASHAASAARGEKKKVLMKELRRNTRVELVDIRESCGLSDLKRNGYEKAERYKDSHHLDMILHVYLTLEPFAHDWRSDLSLIDLYTKKVKEVSIETRGIPIELGFRGISKKLLVSKDLSRVLREKKKVLGKKEAVVPKEAGESPEEIEDFLIQYGPRLIAEDQYNRVLELIEDLPGRRRRHIQIRTLECFANLKGWVCDKDKYCKLSWWKLRQKLIDSEDNEATPMLVILLKDENHYLRIYAAELLGHIGDKRALEDLRAVGEGDENRKARKYAKKAYEQISGEKF